MPFYADSDQLYTSLKALFTHIGNEAPEGVAALQTQKLVIRLRCTAPAVQVTVNGRIRPPQVAYGPSTLRPDLDAELAADTLHRILLQEVSIRKAIGDGLIKVRGPIWKTQALVDLLRAGRAFYPQVLREQGLGQ
jgi:hypothetical protein